MAERFIQEVNGEEKTIATLAEGNEWTIGRDPDASQIVIEDPAVSRRHAVCRKDGEEVFIENVSETNPLLINDVEIQGPQLLQSGQIIKLGNSILRYEATEDMPKPESIEAKMEPSEDSLFDEHATAGKDALAEINFEVVDTGRWLLKVIGGPNNGAEFSMQASNNYIIGTDPNACDIIFHDTSVSRQHARISITSDDKLFIEDLKSRNGTLLDGEPLKQKKQLQPNNLVTMGTTSFVVYDREGEMQTIISPLLPSIVKALQKEEPKSKQEPIEAVPKIDPEIQIRQQKIAAAAAKEKAGLAVGGFVMVTIITALVVIIGIGTATLFRSEHVVKEETVDATRVLEDVMRPWPSIKYNFNKSTGRLFLVGHVLSSNDKDQLLYNLQGLNFIKTIDPSGIIIDEGVWQEMNQLLGNNPNWKGITVNASAPGKFVLSGYLQTRKQADQLSQYIGENFRYLDLLERKIVVDEDVIAHVTTLLQKLNIKGLAVQMSNGELTLTGGLPENKSDEFQQNVDNIRKINGVRLVKNYITPIPPEQTLVDISDKYSVTGSSRAGNFINVVINGRILTSGDNLDGMTITNITPTSITLKKDNVQYRIDYSR